MRDTVARKIGLLDAMGYGNLGDAAIQDSVIANIRRRVPLASIVAFSFVPSDTTERHGIPCYPISRHCGRTEGVEDSSGSASHGQSIFKRVVKRVTVLHALARLLAGFVRESLFLVRSYKTVHGLDLLIISGGGQLGDLWGGPWSHPFNLLKFSVLARLAGKRLYFLNVGAEALEHWLSRLFARTALRLADYISLRDANSQVRVKSLGVKRKTYVHADLAYGLEVSNVVGGTSCRSTRRRVGLNPMGFCDPRIWPRKERSVYDAYMEKLTRFSWWLLEQGYSLRLFATSPGVDKYAIADLERRLLEMPPPGGVTVPGLGIVKQELRTVLCASVNEVLREMAECDFITTSKYHGVIFSHLLRKPVIALGYERKIAVAMDAAHQGEFYASIEHFEAEWLVESFRSLVRRSESISAQEAITAAVYKDNLQKQFDELFLPTHSVRTAAAQLMIG